MPNESRDAQTTPPTPLDGAAYALELCAGAHGVGWGDGALSDEFARAAIIAYLNLTGREAEAERLSEAATN